MTTTPENRTAAAPAFAPGKHLAFRLATEQYGIAVMRVREILGMVEITPLPRTPDHVRGVVNLRGRIVPVIDLRRRFGMPPAVPTAETCIVVVDLGKADDAALRVGCIVDSVSEVLTITAEQFEPTPRCANAPGDCVTGLAKGKDHVLIVLDVDRVVGELDPAATGQGR